MKWVDLLRIVGADAAFPSSALLAGQRSAASVRLQVSRWCRSGRLIQLCRGTYMLAPPYRKTEAHPFMLAHLIRRASYVSLQSALAYHGLIPEIVPAVTSVTTGRPCEFRTPAGAFLFRHVRKDMFTGYRREQISPGQFAHIATPEKALLDLVYLTPGGDRAVFLKELRLQATEHLDGKALERLSASLGGPKLRRAARRLGRILKG
jgi:predicted transcriptional regulator of viral defense system